MPVQRLLPTEEGSDLIELVREIADKELQPKAAPYERAERFPREAFSLLGEAGLLALPFPEEHGGGGQPYEVYLQVLEEIAARWAAVAVGVSVHALTCGIGVAFTTDQQRNAWLPDMLGGTTLGAYCLSEPHAGSDPAAMVARAVKSADGYVANGAKAWITHGGHADYYITMLRTSEDAGRGISCFYVPADTPGLTAEKPEDKMGLMSSTTTTMRFEDAHISESNRIGDEGQGLPIALAGLDAGRLGIAACAVGLAQGSLDAAVAYATQRTAFGRKIIDHQGLAFLLADMEAAVSTARAAYIHAARLKDAGLPYAKEASIAKLVATDNAMKVTTDGVQVLGGAGYTKDFPVERFMREAKVMQIFEGTNQIQRLVISRHLSR